MSAGDRAQSEVVGVALLIGVVVTAVGIVGVLVLSDSGANGTDDPLADLEIDATTTAINLTHAGGDAIPADDVRVVVRGEDRTQRLELDATNLTGSDDAFGLGDRFERAHGLTGRTATILVVHTPTNTVLAERRLDLRARGSQSPQTSFTMTPSNPTPGELVNFNAGATSDSDGRVLQYTWDFDGDGTIDATGETATHRYGSAGTYDAAMTATDNDGNSATATRTVTVATVVPSAALIFSPDPAAQQSITLDASGSTDANGDIDSYEWTFGDGATMTTPGPTVSHTYADGSYTASVRVVDANGNSDTSSVTFTVDATAPTVTSTTLTDGGDDVVTVGDSVTVTADVTDAGVGVDTVTADTSAFDAGTVSLTDGDGDGTYDRTVTVGSSPTEGVQSVTVTATDTYGNSQQVTTSDTVRVDTTAPTIDTFDVTDESFSIISIFYFEQYQVDWGVSDATALDVRVFVNRSTTTQEEYSGTSGNRQYTGGRIGFSGREHTITVIAVDDAGNRACREVVDDADGTDPDSSQYSSC